jgi:multisubunit Na+/H+ antiporter MnhC subunit
MAPEADDLEWELQRNLKLRQELGAEARLELLVARGAAAAEGHAVSSEPHAPSANRVMGAALITASVVGLALAAFIVIWLIQLLQISMR